MFALSLMTVHFGSNERQISSQTKKPFSLAEDIELTVHFKDPPLSPFWAVYSRLDSDAWLTWSIGYF